MPNNVINSGSKKRRDEGATPFAAGYGERWANAGFTAHTDLKLSLLDRESAIWSMGSSG